MVCESEESTVLADVGCLPQSAKGKAKALAETCCQPCSSSAGRGALLISKHSLHTLERCAACRCPAVAARGPLPGRRPSPPSLPHAPRTGRRVPTWRGTCASQV